MQSKFDHMAGEFFFFFFVSIFLSGIIFSFGSISCAYVIMESGKMSKCVIGHP